MEDCPTLFMNTPVRSTKVNLANRWHLEGQWRKKKDPKPNPSQRYTDPRIRIRIRTKMSRIRNTSCQIHTWRLFTYLCIEQISSKQASGIHQTEESIQLILNIYRCYFATLINCSVADPDPGSGAFLTPGSGIWDPEWIFSGSRISDPGSQDHILKSFLTIFLVKSSIIL